MTCADGDRIILGDGAVVIDFTMQRGQLRASVSAPLKLRIERQTREQVAASNARNGPSDASER